MRDASIDPGTLQGDALTKWYLRSPAEIDQERQSAAVRRYQDFFHGSSGTDPDSGFAQEMPEPLPIAPPVGELRRPPAAVFGPAQSAAAQRGPWAPAFSRFAWPSTTPVRSSGLDPERQPAPASRLRADQTIVYGALRTPAPSDRELAQLRQQQAAFADTTRKIDLQNSWLAIPALAPVGAVIGLDGAAAIAGRALGAEGIEGPLNFVDREAWQRGAQEAAQALSDAEKNALRAAARTKFARANGISATEMQAEVHHSDPLEWAHLKPNADPNRLANLWGLRKEAHAIATREWVAFTRSLEGRLPTQAELMEAKLRIDRLVEPYIRRAGLPRSNQQPGKGGPL